MAVGTHIVFEHTQVVVVHMPCEQKGHVGRTDVPMVEVAQVLRGQRVIVGERRKKAHRVLRSVKLTVELLLADGGNFLMLNLPVGTCLQQSQRKLILWKDRFGKHRIDDACHLLQMTMHAVHGHRTVGEVGLCAEHSTIVFQPFCQRLCAIALRALLQLRKSETSLQRVVLQPLRTEEDIVKTH